MGRLLYLELKRVVTARSVWILLVILILLSAVLAYFPVSFERTYRVDEQGNVSELSGMDAIAYQKQIEKENNGEITEEKIREAILVFQECYREYGAVFPPDVPKEVYVQKILPIYPILKAAAHVLAREEVSVYTMTDADIAPDDAPKFYEQYQERMAFKGKNEAEQEKIRELNGGVKMPFTYNAGFSMTSLEYLSLYILLMLLVFIVIISPIFSAEYQTGADSILRCTRYGRIHLAAAKIVTAVLIFAVTFLIGIGSFLLITNQVYGAEGLETSVQMLWDIFVIPALTVGQAQSAAVAAGFLSIFAAVCCTLFLSARCRNVQDTLKIALLIVLLPVILYIVSDAEWVNVIRYLLPSGGVGLSNSFLFELLGTNFVHAGQAAIWSPCFIIGAALAEIPLFLALTVRTYCRRESTN